MSFLNTDPPMSLNGVDEPFGRSKARTINAAISPLVSLSSGRKDLEDVDAIPRAARALMSPSNFDDSSSRK